MLRKLPLIAVALVALALPAAAEAGWMAERVAVAHVAGRHLQRNLERHRRHHRHHRHHHVRRAEPAAVPAECPDADIEPTSANLDRVRDAILCLHNRIRAAHDLPLLHANGRLRRAAERHSDDMVRAGYFDHTSPSGSTMVDRILDARYAGDGQGWMLGENLEWGTGRLATPRGAVQSWMDSPGHRGNMLKRGYRHVGVGIALGVPVHGAGDGATYTVDFGARY